LKKGGGRWGREGQRRVSRGAEERASGHIEGGGLFLLRGSEPAETLWWGRRRRSVVVVDRSRYRPHARGRVVDDHRRVAELGTRLECEGEVGSRRRWGGGGREGREEELVSVEGDGGIDRALIDGEEER
jgi:hypothetical protein